MNKKVLHTIQCHQMLAPRDKVVIGLSGGADSMALAFFLKEYQKTFDLTLTAVHINHKLRGEEAERDAAFVAEWCLEQGIPCRVIEKDVAALAAKKGISTELAGREARYEAFHAFGEDCKIATAHTLSDAVETVLFRLARGASLDGVCGIPPVRGHIIRPLIDCARGEIEAYCAENHIPYVTDSTNFTNDYKRNLLRNEAVPVLKQINPALEAAVSRFVACARADASYLEKAAQGYYKQILKDNQLDCSAYCALPEAMRSRVLCIFLEANGFTPEYKHIMAADRVARHGGKEQFAPDFGVKRFKNNLTVYNFSKKEPPRFEIMNKLVLSNEEFLNISENEKNSFDFCGDYDKIKGSVLVRPRMAGDVIHLPRRGCGKTLKKYLNEIGIPEEKRGAVPVLADEMGVIGLAGITCDSRVAPSDGTRRFLVLKVGEKNDA